MDLTALTERLKQLWGRVKLRLAPLADLSAWVLILLAVIPLILIDWAMVKTLFQWTVFSTALAGLSIVICRIILPQIDLTEWVERARSGEPGAGLVVLSTCLVVAAVFLGLVLWAKA